MHHALALAARTARTALPALAALALLRAVPAAAPGSPGAQNAPPFAWPDGARMALSLSFDDGRESQVDAGAALLARHGVRATFFVVPAAVERRLDGWKRLAAAGHEIANHSGEHPCSGNFPWARAKALEDYTLERMRAELVRASDRIEALLGVRPRTFAYPCGQTFVGRGAGVRHYGTIVHELFLAGRTWLDETAADPAFVDLAQVPGVEMDGKELADLRPALEDARARGAWLVLAGHEIGSGGRQTTRVSLLDALIPYAKDPANGIWIAPVADVAAHVRRSRSAPEK